MKPPFESTIQLRFVGVVLGIVAALGLTRLIAGFLSNVSPWDPVVFLAAPLILAVVALIAVWLPATRASRVEPIQALHAE
jgi:ABC-type antimicrobial peptide transport system permease subunit